MTISIEELAPCAEEDSIALVHPSGWHDWALCIGGRFDFNDADARAVADKYRSHSYPLDVFVLDMDWHRKNSWAPDSRTPLQRSLCRISASRGVVALCFTPRGV